MPVFRYIPVLALLLGAASFYPLNAVSAPGPMPISLKHLPVPAVPGLLDGIDPIIVNKEAAIALGKALFWDTAVGSDGMTCGSCHFHAGADRRVSNQIAPGGQSTPQIAKQFDVSAANNLLGPNHTLEASDFPLHQRQAPLEEFSPVIYNSNNVAGSSGTFSGEFKTVNAIDSNDDCNRSTDSLFHVGGIGTRKATPRNAPSVINAVFNHRSFWDGRANNVFNGSSPWGSRDANAGVWVKINNTTVQKQGLNLINSSLASLAVAPPLNDTEMSCRQRTFKDLGRKLLNRKPLEKQKVHPQDSVLGPLSLSSPGNLQPGLDTTYRILVSQAFNRKYWSYSKRGAFGWPTAPGQMAYAQIEANFAMFFGLAIQLYESTLISDEAPFDKSARDADNQPIELSAAEQRGLEQFRENQCALCHLGPNFTAAAVNANAAIAHSHPEVFADRDGAVSISASSNVVDRAMLVVGGAPVTAFYDTGFASTGVAETFADLGLGGLDEFGNPLSFSQQYMQHLLGNAPAVLDADVARVRACDFQEAFAVSIQSSSPGLFTPVDGIRSQPQTSENCFLPPAIYAFLPTQQAALIELNKPNSKKMHAQVNASFKTPSLRNVELTGPYMHNGSMATLEQVVEFYTRAGNFNNDAKQVTRVFQLHNLQFSEQNRADLVAFLKTLTDDRVRYEKAPFDHPEIKVPNGHVGDNLVVSAGNPLAASLAQDQYLTIDAVGAEGNQSPLLPFKDYLAP